MTSRQDAADIFKAGLMAVRPGTLMANQVRRSPDGLLVGGRLLPRDAWDRLIVLGVGKAAAAMADAVERELGDWVCGGLVVTKTGHGLPLRYLPCIESGHPIPDAIGREASQAVLDLVATLGDGDLLLVLVSGGASALLPDSGGLPFDEVQDIFRMLLHSGADISEMNAVRKHLSAIKGGHLARLVYPARVVTLILSDIAGDALDVVGSGPTAPDPTTFADACAVLEKYGLWEKAGARVRDRLQRGREGYLPETPKPGDPIFGKVDNRVIGNNRMALEGAAARARQLGYQVDLRLVPISGEARLLAEALAREFLSYDGPRPACILMGGETTVTVTGTGKGGRNQEFALALLCAWRDMGIAPDELPTVLSAGTDGTDGPTEVAGAFADGNLLSTSLSMEQDPRAFLADNDSFTYLGAAGARFFTGPTFTNVADMLVVLID
jgi:glycerate 2-kinase